MRITALDFETANYMKGSICSVGIVTYDHGVEADAYSSLIRPHRDIYSRGWSFEYLHGIKRSDVADSPEFPDLLEEISGRLTSADIVVCHSAGFDINQLRAVLRIYGLNMPDFTYACTCMASRKLLRNLPNHKLNTVAEHFGFPFRHHDALDDARAAGYIMQRMVSDHPSILSFADSSKIKLHRFL